MSTTNGVNCPSCEELDAYSLGKLPEATLEEVFDHLETCDQCLATLSTLEQGDDSLLGGLRKSSSGEQFLHEPECHEAVLQLEAIGCHPSPSLSSDNAPVASLPKELGRYELLEELGRGGMGTVYVARDRQLDREVALKIPHFKPNENPRLLQRFQREARTAATIEHPNLCPVYDVGEIDGIPYLSMARIRGKSLSKLIKARGQFPQREAAEIVRKVTIAVQKAHAQGIVHRDIKPSNIMISEQGEPILTDFGLAQRLELEDPRLTRSGFIVGTPSYMAPEQVEGDPETTGPSCDVYSLGIVLYELLIGEVPFRGPLLSVLSQLGRNEPKPPSARRPKLDRRLEAICLKAMAKQPEDRYRTAAEMAEALQQYLQGSAYATSPPSRRRRLGWISAAGAAALFLAFGAIISVVTNRGTLEIKTFDEHVKVSVLKDGQEVTIVDTKTGKKVTLHAGKYELKLSEGKPRLWLSTNKFTLRRGGQVIVEVCASGDDQRQPPERPAAGKPPIGKQPVTMEWVTVGNPGNAGQWSGVSYGGNGPNRVCGAVDYTYNIGTYEVTAGQYTEFLNAVGDTDTYGLYNAFMWSNSYGCKIQRSGTSGSYTYNVAAEWADRPVNYVSWGDAARFANWMHNGQPTGAQGLSTTEDGSYYLNGAISDKDLMAVTRDADHTWVIPSEDEWYKAAYHKNDGVTRNYWDYPTGTHTTPSNNLIDPDPGNNANFYRSAHTIGGYTIGGPYYRTEVGEFENSQSPYGTFDQGGNIWEWNEAIILDSSTRGLRGGSFSHNSVSAYMHAATRNAHHYPSDEYYSVGFRVVRIPETEGNRKRDRSDIGKVGTLLPISAPSRYPCQRGRPYGTAQWQKKIAMRLVLESSYRSAGRRR